MKLELFDAAGADKPLLFVCSSISTILSSYLFVQGLCKLCTVHGFLFFPFFFLHSFLSLLCSSCSSFPMTSQGVEATSKKRAVTLRRPMDCCPENDLAAHGKRALIFMF